MSIIVSNLVELRYLRIIVIKFVFMYHYIEVMKCLQSFSSQYFLYSFSVEILFGSILELVFCRMLQWENHCALKKNAYRIMVQKYHGTSPLERESKREESM